MRTYKINILILIILQFSCDNPIDTDVNESQDTINNDPCLVYIQEIDCLDFELQECQWIGDECVSSDYYSCTTKYGGLIDECGVCSGGTTNIIPNKDKDVCGVCFGSSTSENFSPLYYDKNGDGENDTLCGCLGNEGVELNSDFCCGDDVRDACDFCGGDGVDSDEDGICDEKEIVGCQDSNACNYNEFATESNNDCVYLDGICDSCIEGEVIDNDIDDDGICDLDEIEGCSSDETACNYVEFATDEVACIFVDGICDSCIEGEVIDNDTDDDGICDDVDNCPLDFENDADGDGVCETDEIEGCSTDATACNYVESATEEVECILPEIYDCEGNCLVDVDCNSVCGGTAYYNYCSYCVGGNTGLLHTHGSDNCGVCNGQNKDEDFCNVCFGDNTECTQGIITLSGWNFDFSSNWQNSECEGPSHYDYYNYFCINGLCYDFRLNFFETGNRFIFEGVSWESSSNCNWLLDSDSCITEEIPNIEGTWTLDIQSYSPLLINGDNLCLNYDDEELNDFCFESIELLNNYQDCLIEPDSCSNNILYLTTSDEEKCIKEHYSTDNFIYSNQDSYNIIDSENLSYIAKNILFHIQKNTQ